MQRSFPPTVIFFSTKPTVISFFSKNHSSSLQNHCSFFLQMSSRSFNSVSSHHSCHCGDVAPIMMSWTDDNPGRRFVGCCNFKRGKCKFFKWIDDPCTPIGRLRQFHHRNEELVREIEGKNSEIEFLRMQLRIVEKKASKRKMKLDNLDGKNRWAKKNMFFGIFVAVIFAIIFNGNF